MDEQQREPCETDGADDEIDDDEGAQPASIAEWFKSESAMIWAGIGLFFVLYYVLRDRPWGVQTATLSAYTVFVFGLTFRKAKYSLRLAGVRDPLPQLLLIHCAFLALVYGIQTYALGFLPRLPHFLLTSGRRHPSLFASGLGLIVLIVLSTQVVWTWAILDRSLENEQEQNPNQ